MTEYAAPPPDDKDWTWTVERRCPECGFDASVISTEALPAVLAVLTTPWAEVLDRAEVRDRPNPTIWSALEYGCHVRDVCRVFTGRTRLMLEQDAPTFPNWDQDGAADEGQYHQQDPATVAAELVAAATTWADTYRTVADDQWGRIGLRGNGAAFTVLTLGRYGIHDLAHHLVDVGAVEPGSW